ncbi:unnamed protein product [Linum tenue]|uniref:Uncharacterized protein n=1 Tax=Linum tenue TaxID=586396 RepID=A0AAV0GPP4_9ROSI|nr:unnamed protein product [Linum tenue]
MWMGVDVQSRHHQPSEGYFETQMVVGLLASPTRSAMLQYLNLRFEL